MRKYPKKLTPKQITSSFAFNVMKRVLKQEHNWIKNILVDEEHLNEFHAILLKVVIDPYILAEEYGWEIRKEKEDFIRNSVNGEVEYLGILFEIDMDESDKIDYMLSNTLTHINESKHLPDEFKFAPGRNILISYYIINPKDT